MLRNFNSRVNWNEVGGLGRILEEVKKKSHLPHQGKSKFSLMKVLT